MSAFRTHPIILNLVWFLVVLLTLSTVQAAELNSLYRDADETTNPSVYYYDARCSVEESHECGVASIECVANEFGQIRMNIGGLSNTEFADALGVAQFAAVIAKDKIAYFSARSAEVWGYDGLWVVSADANDQKMAHNVISEGPIAIYFGNQKITLPTDGATLDAAFRLAAACK